MNNTQSELFRVILCGAANDTDSRSAFHCLTGCWCPSRGMFQMKWSVGTPNEEATIDILFKVTQSQRRMFTTGSPSAWGGHVHAEKWRARGGERPVKKRLQITIPYGLRFPCSVNLLHPPPLPVLLIWKNATSAEKCFKKWTVRNHRRSKFSLACWELAWRK